MKCKNEKMGYVMPQTTIYTLVGECPILAGSPPVDTTPKVVPLMWTMMIQSSNQRID